MDPSVFTALMGLLLGGGVAAAYATYRRTPYEAESISVTTLRGVIEELRVELDRKDRQLAEQNRTIGELRHRVEKLEDGAQS